MNTMTCNGSTFYIDDLTRKLSYQYDIKQYKGPCLAFIALEDASGPEGIGGKFMFLAKMCGQFVGVDFTTYMKKFPDEQWTDSLDSDLLPWEDYLKCYLREAYEQLGERLCRIETVNNKKIYFPTGPLIQKMMQGIQFIPMDQFHRMPEKPDA